MATGLMNGTDLIIKVGTDATSEVIIASATTCSLELSMDEIDQTNKSSGGWKAIMGGLRSWSVSAEALYQNEAVAGSSDYIDFWNHIGQATADGALARTPVYIELQHAQGTAGDSNVFYSGSAYVTSLSVNGGTEDQASYSISLTGTGVLSKTAVV
jgi:TP901-1 family phage major tail protein|tara:strand:- start:990 stop:1457 length:468 start_codon:yes stop_codon:yes gene_type:complete